MKTAKSFQPRRDTLNLRIPAAERNLIDRAALSTGKTRTDFILGAARRAAEDALLDRAILSVGAEAYAEFLVRLDAPAQPNERLCRTMQAPTLAGTRIAGRSQGFLPEPRSRSVSARTHDADGNRGRFAGRLGVAKESDA